MGKNQIVDPALMEEKWQREIKFLCLMNDHYPDLIPEILDIDQENKKIYLRIDGVDFWQKHYDENCTYEDVLPDWNSQMLNMLTAYKSLGFYKYSLHPSSYFVINGQLKSINYFFCHDKSEPEVPLEVFKSHISLDRQAKLEAFMNLKGIGWQSVVPYKQMQLICLESFRENYTGNFIDEAIKLFVS
jgi:hypothetical protein